jgi:hypothetical protein
MRHWRVVLGLVLAGVAVSGTARAQTTALNLFTPPARTGHQAYPLTLGQDFTVNVPINVLEIGAFDSGQDGFVGTITAALFSRTGNTGVVVPGSTTTFTAGSPGTLSSPSVGGSSAYRWKTIPTLALAPGTYTIAASGFSGSDPNGNTSVGDPAPTFNTGGGAITFGSARFSVVGPMPTFPESPDTATYLAGTFTFEPIFFPTPEPGTVALLIGMLVSGTGLAMYRRLRRRR